MKSVTMQDIADALGISKTAVSKALHNSDGLEDAMRTKILQKAVEMGYRRPQHVGSPSKKPAPTMKDVAQEAGVALGTVSKVVNGIPVGEDYRVRVDQAVKKLSYRINNYAKGLRSKQTYVIEVMIPNLINPFFAKLVNCICKELAQRNYKMLLCTTDADPNLEQAYLFWAEQQRVDGIICLSYDPRLQVPENIPLISIDRYFGAKIPCVASDNYGGGRLAAEKLAENGCRNLACLRIGWADGKIPVPCVPARRLRIWRNDSEINIFNHKLEVMTSLLSIFSWEFSSNPQL